MCTFCKCTEVLMSESSANDLHQKHGNVCRYRRFIYKYQPERTTDEPVKCPALAVFLY